MKIYKYLLLLVLFCTTLFSQQIDKVSLQLLWKHQFEFAGFYMAKEKGFYKDNNLEVELKEYSFGTDIVKDIENGKSTFGIEYPKIILDKSNGTNVVLLNALYQSSPHILITLESSGIKSIDDFKNKKIMMENNAIKTAPLLSMLYSKNINLAHVDIIKPSYNVEDLIDGRTDIFSAYISNEIHKLDKLGVKYNIWNPSDYGFDFYNDLLFTSSKILKNNPNKVKRFQNASLRGWKYAFNNIEETVDLILKKYNTQNKTKEALLYEAKTLKKLAYKNNIAFGNISQDKIQRIYDVYNLMGLTNKTIDLDSFIYKPIKNTLNLTDEEIKFTIDNPILNVSHQTNAPPYSFNKDNIQKGFSIDYLNLLEKKLDITFQYINVNDTSKLPKMIKDGIVDVVPYASKSKEREKYFNFTVPYIKSNKAIFTNNKNIDSLESLKNKTVSIVKNIAVHKYLEKNYPSIKLDLQDNFSDTIKAVINGKADALIGEASIINYLLVENTLKLSYTKLINKKDLSKDFHIVTRKNLPILQNILNKAMLSIEEKDLLDLKRKWFGNKIKKNKELQNISLTNEEKKYLEKKKTITMCIDPNWMPFERFENGKHIGMSADYFKLFSKNLNIEIEPIITNSWAESIQYAKNRKCDILSLAMETPERKKYLNFTSSYLQIPLVIATKIDVPFVNDISSIENKEVGITKGYAFIEILKEKYPNLNIVEVKSIKEGLYKVNKDELFGYIGTLASVGYQFQNGFTGELKIAGKFDENWELGIAVRSDDKILLRILEKAVKNIDAAKRQKILNDWISIKYEKGMDYKIIWQILIVICIIGLFFLYRQYILSKTNKKLKIIVDKKTKDLKILNANLEIKIAEEVEKNLDIQEKLFKSEKMAAMGEMIGNISHQWRQPLSVITTAATGIQLQKEYNILTDEMLEKSCNAINDNAQYLSKTIDDFKNFIKGDRDKHLYNIRKAINSFLNLMEGTIKTNHIDVILNIDDKININGYENELTQCLINIFNNAKDALQDVNEDDRFIFITIVHLSTSNNISISIKDSGGGIPENILSKVFDPYFTTKHKSQGTGLGLNMTYKLITEGMDGTIEAYNVEYQYTDKKYRGAEFKIILPNL